MFRNAIPGMDMIFQTEPPPGSIILIVGGPGTLKSAFVYNLLSNHLLRKERGLTQGIYVTLEETRESLLRNMKSLGIKHSERIQISDIASFMRDLEHWSDFVTTEKDYIELILEKASRPFKFYKRFDIGFEGEDRRSIDGGNGGRPSPGNRKDSDALDLMDGPETILKPTMFVLDSLNALNAIVYRSIKNARKELNQFMFKLREKGVTSFIVMEVGDAREHRPEHFLVDGIIELGMTETKQKRYKRYIRVQKMRSTKHSIEPFLIETTEDGIKVVEELI